MTNNVIELKAIHFQYEREKVLEDIYLSIPRGAFVGLIGPNGSGKSTLIKIILGLLKPNQGSVQILGTDINKFKEWYRIGYVSQKANSFNSGFPATVFEVVSSGLTGKLGLFRFLSKKDKKLVMEAIKAVGMESFTNKNIGELSGGQQQRVFIARALVLEPDILILDEPTVGVDEDNVQSFYHLLKTLNKDRGITLLMVTHDMDTIINNASHIAQLNKKLLFYGTSEELKRIKENNLALMNDLFKHANKRGGKK